MFHHGRTVDLRQSKRYRLRASAAFSWESIDGHLLSGAGSTRDISPNGVFVVSVEKIPLGAAVTLAMTLPTTSGQLLGATLNTLGRVVRIEGDGFAVAADMGLRMQSPENRFLCTKENGNCDGKHEATGRENGCREVRTVLRFSI